MNLENVRYLLTALDTGSFSAAAVRLNLTPSGLNRQISALEKDLGTVLLLRNRRGVLLAPGTERILARLREAVAAENRVKEEITAAKGLLTGHLSIGGRGAPDRFTTHVLVNAKNAGVRFAVFRDGVRL